MVTASTSQSHEEELPPDLLEALHSSNTLIQAPFHTRPTPSLQTIYEKNIGVFQHYMEQGKIDTIAPFLSKLARRAAIDGLNRESVRLTALALMPTIHEHGRDSEAYLAQLCQDILSYGRHGHSEIALLLADELLEHGAHSKATELLYWHTRTLWAEEQFDHIESLRCAQKSITLNEEVLAEDPPTSTVLVAEFDVHLSLTRGYVETNENREAHQWYLKTRQLLILSKAVLTAFAPYWERKEYDLDILQARLTKNRGDTPEAIRILESSLEKLSTARINGSSSLSSDDKYATFGKLLVTLVRIGWNTDWESVRRGLQEGRKFLNPKERKGLQFGEQSALVDVLTLSYHYLTELTEQLAMMLDYSDESGRHLVYSDVAPALENTILGEEFRRQNPQPDMSVRALVGITAKKAHADMSALKEQIEIADDYFDKAVRLKTALRRKLVTLRRAITPGEDPIQANLKEKAREIQALEATLPSLYFEGRN